MSENKRYRLLKDLPQCKAGTIFEKYSEDAIDYVALGILQWDSGKCKKVEVFLLDCHIENNPEWFELITERPPIGIMPEWRWKELRLRDVQGAIDRCVEADKPIPTDFIEEKYQLQTWLNKRKQLNALMNGNNSEKQSLPETKPMSESKGLNTDSEPNYKFAGNSKILVDEKTDRTEVREFWFECHSVGGGSEYCFQVSKSIPKEKFNAIKNAIEWVTNEDEGKPAEIAIWAAIKVLEQSEWLCIKRKEFNQQRDKEITDAFNAARESSGSYGTCIGKYPQYPTLEDYLKSISNQK